MCIVNNNISNDNATALCQAVFTPMLVNLFCMFAIVLTVVHQGCSLSLSLP